MPNQNGPERDPFFSEEERPEFGEPAPEFAIGRVYEDLITETFSRGKGHAEVLPEITERVLKALTSSEVIDKLEALGFKPIASAEEIPQLHLQQRVSDPESFKKWQEGFAKFLEGHSSEDD